MWYQKTDLQPLASRFHKVSQELYYDYKNRDLWEGGITKTSCINLSVGDFFIFAEMKVL